MEVTLQQKGVGAAKSRLHLVLRDGTFFLFPLFLLNNLGYVIPIALIQAYLISTRHSTSACQKRSLCNRGKLVLQNLDCVLGDWTLFLPRLFSLITWAVFCLFL